MIKLLKTLTLACFATLAFTAQNASAAVSVAPSQKTVHLLKDHSVLSIPNGQIKGVVKAQRPITHARTVLPVLATRVDAKGSSWLKVRLPGREMYAKTLPKTGFIRSQNTRPATTDWHIIINRGNRKVYVYKAGRIIRRYRAIVGTTSTPTPRGRFFVEENVQMPVGSAGGPFALATSARSPVLQEFAGGPGQIAIHGVQNLPGQMGTAQSHGCIRLENANITWLARRIAPGVPISIV